MREKEEEGKGGETEGRKKNGGRKREKRERRSKRETEGERGVSGLHTVPPYIDFHQTCRKRVVSRQFTDKRGEPIDLIRATQFVTLICVCMCVFTCPGKGVGRNKEQSSLSQSGSEVRDNQN